MTNNLDHRPQRQPLAARITAAQTSHRRSVSNTLATLKAYYFPTAYDRMLDAEVSILLDSIAEEFDVHGNDNHLNGQETEAIRGGRILVITGKAGASKTRTIQHVLRNRPELQGYGDADDPMEVLSVVAPAPFSLKSLGHEILRRTGYPLRRELRETEVWPVVLARFREIGVRILWIDEAQHGDQINNQETAQRVLDTFKRVLQNEDHPVWLILSGTPELAHFAQNDASVRRRVRHLPFEPLSFAKHASLMRSLIRRSINMCPGMACGSVQNDEIAGRILHAADGQFGIAVEYVQDAIRECLLAGETTLQIKHFAEVYACRTGVSEPDLNVFLAREWDAISVEYALYDDCNGELIAKIKARKRPSRNRGAEK